MSVRGDRGVVSIGLLVVGILGILGIVVWTFFVNP